MHDIRWIRENAKAFDAALARRGLPGEADKLIAIDERRRAAILKFEQAQARRNAASKEIGQAKAKKDEATAQKLMAEVNELKDKLPALEAESKAAEEEAQQGARDNSEPAARRSAGRQGRDRQRRAPRVRREAQLCVHSPSSISSWAKRSA